MTEISNGVYMPPEGVYFRLYNYAKDYCIFARDHTTPYTGCVWKNYTAYDDQFFTLVKRDSSTWSLKNKRTGKYLKAEIESNGWVYHSEEQSDKTPEESKWNGYFTVIFCTNSHQGWLRCNDDGFWTPDLNLEAPFSHQYWSMLYEDMEFDGIKWDTYKAKIGDQTPVVLFSQDYKNRGSGCPEYTIAFKDTVAHTSEFTHTIGITVKSTSGGKVGIPFVTEGEVKVEIEGRYAFSWGTKETTTKEYSFNQKFTAPPWTKHRAKLRVTKGNLSVPFVAIYKSLSTGQEAKAWGVWNGVVTWDLEGDVELVERYEEKKA